MVRVDLHLHSSASRDCVIDPEQLAARCRQLGLDPMFLTDHNTVVGAARLQKLIPQRVVLGEEITTGQGELIGLFLKRRIPKGMPAFETAQAIKAQGGLVYLEHPYDTYRRHLKEEAIEELADLIDIVEVFNGRSDEKANRQAEDLRATLGAAPGAGSDAHTLAEVGSVYIEMEDFDGPQDFLAKLRTSRIVKPRKGLLAGLRRRIRAY